MTSNESGVLLQDVLDMMLEAERKLGPNGVVSLFGTAVPSGVASPERACLRVAMRVTQQDGRKLRYGIRILPEVLQRGNAATEILQYEFDGGVREILGTIENSDAEIT